MNYLKDNLATKLLNEELEINLDSTEYSSFQSIQKYAGIKTFSYWIFGLLAALFLGMFLPWTQNVRASGDLTTQKPNHRPQTINTLISGQIKEWKVIEGQHVHKGDTLVQISEVKDKFFDPDLIKRTEEQLDAKKGSLKSYEDKVEAQNNLIAALKSEMKLKSSMLENKVEQSRLKVISDSNNYIAAKLNYTIASRRLARTDSLYGMGIKSLTDLESKKTKFQESSYKLVSAENNYTINKTNYTNAIIDRNNIINTYNSKISKAESDRFSAQSSLFTGQAEVAKLENLLTNYRIRNGLYYITSPIDGYIFKTHYSGAGEIVKEGSPVVTVVPKDMDKAIALYVKPVDLPLIKLGEKIRLIFDGWPALVFDGWPNSSFGTFGGEVYAIDKAISKNGKYRVLVIPDKTDEPWPEQLQVGSGAQGIFLLNDVRVWYEIWRNINGFPPEYYNGKKSSYPLDKSIDKKYHTK